MRIKLSFPALLFGCAAILPTLTSGAAIALNNTITTAIDTGLSGNSAYWYQVSTLDNSNNESGWSVAVLLTTPPCPDVTPPSVPTSLLLNGLSCKEVRLSWAPSTARR